MNPMYVAVSEISKTVLPSRHILDPSLGGNEPSRLFHSINGCSLTFARTLNEIEDLRCGLPQTRAAIERSIHAIKSRRELLNGDSFGR